MTPTYKKIIVLEGFDMTGKSTFAEKILLLSDPYHKYKIYNPHHNLTDATIGRHNSWAIGYSIFDFLSQMNLDATDTHIIINRGVFSSYVYSELNGSAKDKLPAEVVDWYRNSQFFKDNVDVLFFQHFSEATAKEIYDASQDREENPNKLSRQLDTFDGFSQYWDTYRRANELFLESFELVGVSPIFLRTGVGFFQEKFSSGEEVIYS